VGFRWGGSWGAVIIGCVVYGIQLGWGCVVSGLVCSTSSGFSSGLLFSVGFFFGLRFPLCVCVCVCVCVRARARGLAYLVYIVTRNDDEISASPRNIGIYVILFEQNCNNLKMAAIGRNM